MLHFVTYILLVTKCKLSFKSLQDYELIYYEFDTKGEKHYSVNDVLFQRWSEGR